MHLNIKDDISSNVCAQTSTDPIDFDFKDKKMPSVVLNKSKKAMQVWINDDSYFGVIYPLNGSQIIYACMQHNKILK